MQIRCGFIFWSLAIMHAGVITLVEYAYLPQSKKIYLVGWVKSAKMFPFLKAQETASSQRRL